ncbi:MAG: DUF302 domain-containing protein [Alphaproteobacteria bacterium]|nr:DUF302 domain-containing protein [Alphaproteobacteria bacterium]
MLGTPSFGLVRTLDCSFEEGVERVRKSLAAHGFGVLTEIDMAGTLKKKLGHEMPPYLILGACHPPSALAAVSAEPAIGLLLPCNVVVTADEAGHAVLGAIDPDAMFELVRAEGIEDVAADVKRRLQGALDDA